MIGPPIWAFKLLALGLILQGVAVYLMETDINWDAGFWMGMIGLIIALIGICHIIQKFQDDVRLQERDR